MVTATTEVKVTVTLKMSKEDALYFIAVIRDTKVQRDALQTCRQELLVALRDALADHC